MNYYIGIDLGTSSLKGILTDAKGNIRRQVSAEYDVICPQNNWTEQNPADWLAALRKVMSSLTRDCSHSVKGISFGGQMHGLVVLDAQDAVIRPCILWNDGRTDKQTRYLNETIGRETLSRLTGNIAFAGFTAPKLLWLYENEPDNFERINKIMLPKDYLAYVLTGVFATDYSDASGTLLLDVQNKRWSSRMLEICRVSEKQLPTLYESYQVIGNLKKEFADEFGLNSDVKVIIGAGDNAAAAIGTGTVANGSCNVSLGTSGTIFISQDSFSVDNVNALHSFAHANGRWHLMGCILSAASCRKWWLEDVLENADYQADEAQIAQTDSGDVIFLPYLSGERSPHNDVNAKGAFVGLTAGTTRAQMSRAIMEGVAFALRDCLEVAASSGVKPMATNLCGGGARSATWRQICADVLNLPVNILTTEQGPSFGAAMLAMVGCGEYADVNQAAQAIVTAQQTIYPVSANVERYNRKYVKFKQLYPLLKQLY